MTPLKHHQARNEGRLLRRERIRRVSLLVPLALHEASGRGQRLLCVEATPCTPSSSSRSSSEGRNDLKTELAEYENAVR
jgi:hypothetical protein